MLEHLVGGTTIRADAFVVGRPKMPGGGLEFLRNLTTRWFDEFARFCDDQNSVLRCLSLRVRDGTGFYRFHCPGFDRRRTVGRPGHVCHPAAPRVPMERGSRTM